MRSLLAALVACLVLPLVALADHLDPQERIRAGDQRRATAMLLQRVDLGSGWAPERTSGLDPHATCKALDESDLVVSGRVVPRYWSKQGAFQIAGSSTAVYATLAHSRTAWARSTRPAALRCAGIQLRDELRRQGGQFDVRVRGFALPRLAEARAGYRVELSGQAGGPALYVDVVVLRQGRARVALVYAGVAIPPSRALEITLARRVAARMARVMRGSP